MDQDIALKILEAGHSAFLTGHPGTGKTFLLNKFIKFLAKVGANYAVTASTGIAATHLNGTTIHSFFGIGIRDPREAGIVDQVLEKEYVYKRIKSLNCLIIDEISMLDGYRIDLIDKILKRVKENKEPFGGIQVVFSGDFFQLPPINKMGMGGEEEIYYAFNSKSWRELNPKILYLNKVYRQEDLNFVELLQKVRREEIDSKVIDLLNSRISNKENSKNILELHTHNLSVDKINNEMLVKISGNTKNFDMTSKGNKFLVENLKKSILAPERLTLKVGAKVIFVKNNFEKGYVNGSLGVVQGFNGGNNLPIVLTNKGERVEVEEVEWMIEENGSVKARIKQVPLRLAWAISIHKSQGMSLDEAFLDLRSTFTLGQGYVALSRVKSLENIYLRGFNENALKVDSNIKDFDKCCLELSLIAREDYELLTTDAQISQVRENLKKWGIEYKEGMDKSAEKNLKSNKTSTYEITENLLKEKKNIEEIAKERGVTVGTIIDHISKLKEKNKDLDLSFIKKDKVLVDKIDKVKKAIKIVGREKLTPIKNELEKIGVDISFDELKIALLFV